MRTLAAFLLLLLATPAPAVAPLPRPRLDRDGEPLPEGAVARLGAARLRFGYPRRFLFSPDGRKLSLQTDSGTRLWDLATGKVVATPPGDSGREILAFTPDGLPAWLGPGKVRILGSDGQVRHELKPPRPEFLADDVVFSPDGKVAAVSWSEKYLGTLEGARVTLHDLGGSRKDSVRLLSPRDSWRPCFSARGNLLAFIEERKKVCIWDWKRGCFLRSWVPNAGPDMPVLAAWFSPDGKKLAVCAAGKTSLLWADTLAEVPGFVPPVQDVVHLRFSADGLVLVGARDTSVFRWSVRTGKELGRLPLPAELARGVLSPDGNLLAACEGIHGPITLREVAGGKERNLEQLHNPLAEVKFLDRETVAVVRRNSSVAFWSVKDGHVLREHRHPAKLSEYVHSRLSPEGKYLAINHDEGGKFTLHEVATGRELWHIDQEKGEFIEHLDFTPDGKKLIMERRDRLLLYDTASGVPSSLGISQHGVLAFSPDGRTLASFSGRVLSLTEMASGKLRAKFGLPRAEEGRGAHAYKVAFARRGGVLALDRLGDLFAVDLDSGRVIFHKPYPDRGDSEEVFALSPEGRWLAHAVRYNRAFQLRDLTRVAGTPLELGGHLASLCDLAFSPDGKSLVSASEDGSALVWDLETVRAIRRRRWPASQAPTPESLWEQLASPDAEAAGRALSELLREPRLAVELLARGLKPARPGPARERIEQLIEDLGSSDYTRRNAAFAELESMRELAGQSLRAARQKAPPLEQARRLEQLLKKLTAPETNPERLRALRGVEVLERIGTPQARAVLETLAGGASAARLTQEAKASLERLHER